MRVVTDFRVKFLRTRIAESFHAIVHFPPALGGQIPYEEAAEPTSKALISVSPGIDGSLIQYVELEGQFLLIDHTHRNFLYVWSANKNRNLLLESMPGLLSKNVG